MKIYRDGAASTPTSRPVLKRIPATQPRREDEQSSQSLSESPVGTEPQPSPVATKRQLPSLRWKPNLTWHQRSVRVPVWALESALALTLVVALVVTILMTGSRGPSPESQVAFEASQASLTMNTPFERSAEQPGDHPGSSSIVSVPPEFQQLDPVAESSRQAYLRSEGYDLEGENATLADQELLRLRAELESIQRNAAILRSLARQQSGDLTVAHSSLEASQEQSEGALHDLDERIRELEVRIATVDELARDLRRVLGLPESSSGAGGPSAQLVHGDDVDPWLALRADIVVIEHQAESLVYDLDEISTEIQIRLLSVQMSGLPRTGSTYDDLQFYDQMPVGWPIVGPVTSRFGGRESPFGGGSEFHTGIDIAAPTGTPVRATGAGTVRISGTNGGYGLLVVIDHGRGISTWYGHNSRLLVSPGQTVTDGQVIAEVGSTGYSTGPHVHYEVRQNNVPMDPLPFMQMTR